MLPPVSRLVGADHVDVDVGVLFLVHLCRHTMVKCILAACWHNAGTRTPTPTP